MILASGRPSPLGQFFSHASSSLALEKCWTGLSFHVAIKIVCVVESIVEIQPQLEPGWR